MAETYADYFRGLARSAGQGVTLGFGDEIEAAVRAIGPETYEEEVAKIRADLAKFRETNPVSAFAGELAGAVPTAVAGGAGLASLGIRGAARIGAVEGAIYGAGTGESAEGRALGAALGAPTGAVAGVVGEKAVQGIAPLVGKFMKRGSGSEIRGATDIQLDAAEQPRATVFDVETGVTSPLEKTVGEPRTSGLPGGVNPAVKKMRDIPGAETVTDSLDYSPIENALRNAEEAMGASPTKGLTGEQYLARLPKVQSVSKSELEASGLESFLRQPENLRRKIPAQELLDVARSRLPKIKTTTLYDSLDNVEYAEEQRLINSEDYDMVEDYFETVFFNQNATDISPMDYGHHRDVGGSIAHVRGSIINDVRAGMNPNGEFRTSVFLEENQNDILAAELAKETLPKKIKQAKDELAVLEQAGDTAKVSDQVRQIGLLEAQLRAYDRAVPVTPQVREAFEKAVQDMEADPEFRTLPDLESQSRDASQRRIKARGETLDASKAIPDREINAQQIGFTLERLEQQMGNSLVSTENPRMRQILLENDLELALSDTPRIILQNGTGDDLAYGAVFASRTRTKRAMGQAQATPEERLADALGMVEEAVKVEPFTIDQINDARALALETLEGVPRSTPLEQLSEAAMNNAPNEDVGRLAQGFMTGLRRLTNKFERVVDERPFPSPGEKEEMVSIFDRDIKRRFGAYDTKIYMEERKRLADAAKKINESETDFEMATFDQEAIENKIEALTKRMADKYKPEEGFMQYLAEVKKIPQLAEYAGEEGISLLPNQPFKNQFQASRSNLMLSIQKAKAEGHRFFYMPDYRDVADLRGMDASKFKVGYKDAPEAVIKELRETFPDLDAGELTDTSSFQDMASDSLRVSKSGKSYRMFRPVTYIDLDTMDTNFKPRRFAKGGPVDLRSGIGNMFRLYS